MNIFFRKVSLSQLGLILLFIYGIFYVGNALSPSSYGVILEQIGAKSEGLFFGKPRPIRSDESTVYTPLLQIAVNNNFERFNKTSPYHEDLRPSFSLPLKDWSIIFKPALLGFHFLPPPYAFSLYYFSIMALFLIGFTLLFRRIGLSDYLALVFALLTYFSGFVQNWWSVTGPIMAFFALSYVILVSDKNFYLKLLLFYYATCCMMFAMFYPVFFYGFTVINLVFLYSFNREFFNFKNLVAFGLCAILALLTYLFYIQDSLLALANTIYPGRRMVTTGGGVSLMQWLSQFFPSLVANENSAQEFSGKFNICETSTIGSYLFLLILIFGDWRKYLKNVSREEIKILALQAAVLLFFSCWMLLPISANLVKIIFLNRFDSIRCVLISGFILLGIAALILKRLEFVVSAKRLILFASFPIAAAIFSAVFYNFYDPVEVLEGVIILYPMLLLILFHYCIYEIDKKYFTAALLAVVVSSNIVVFGRFNPLQSAKPIFNVPQTAFVKNLWDEKNFNQEGFFVGKELSGSVANGLGLPSIGHVLYVPQLKFFRCYFPKMPEEQFNHVFNRYLHVRLGEVSEPKNIQLDLSAVPYSRFLTSDLELRECLKANSLRRGPAYSTSPVIQPPPKTLVSL